MNSIQGREGSGRLTLIDSLRALGVLSVVLFHVFPETVAGGFIGVDIFFAVSGFVIALNYLAPLVSRETSLSAFFLRRIRRLVPAYFLLLVVVTLASVAVMVPKDLANFGQSLAAQAIYLQNIAFWQQGDYFDDPLLKPLLHTWSLAVEEQFYLLFPLLILCFRWGRGLGWAGLLGATGLSIVFGIYLAGISAPAAFYLLPTRVWEFTAGIIAALLYPRVAGLKLPEKLADVAAMAGFAAMFAAIGLFDSRSVFPSGQAAIAIGGASLVFLSEPHVGARLRAIAEARIIQHFGRISYSWYLWHWPVVAIPFIALGRPATLGEALVELIVGYALGVLSYRFVEVPGMRTAILRPLRRTMALLVSFAAFALMAGFFLIMSQGWLGRYHGRERLLYAAQMDRPPYRCPIQRRLASDNAFCHINEREGGSGVLLVGDSHADMMKPVLADMASRAGRPFYLAKNSCRFVPPRSKGACGKTLLKDAVRAVGADQISRVIIIGRYSAEFDEGVFAAAVEALTRAGADVTIVATNPESETFDPEHWIRAGKVQEWPVISFYDRAGYERDERSTLAAMRRIASGNPRVTLLEPYKVLCPDKCLIARGGAPLYHDAHHLTSQGARLVASLYASSIEDR